MWIHNSSWDDQTSITHSPSYNWSLKCQVTDSNGDTDEDIMSSGIVQNMHENIQNKSILQIPNDVILFPNVPNPFNPITQIKFGLPNSQKVQIDVYSLNGKKIKTLLNNNMNAGYHTIIWNGTDSNGGKVSSGVYLYKLRSGNKIFTKKMIFAK